MNTKKIENNIYTDLNSFSEKGYPSVSSENGIYSKNGWKISLMSDPITPENYIKSLVALSIEEPNVLKHIDKVFTSDEKKLIVSRLLASVVSGKKNDYTLDFLDIGKIIANYYV